MRLRARQGTAMRSFCAPITTTWRTTARFTLCLTMAWSADIFSTEIVMGGVHNWLEVFANNHRTRCNINPVDAMSTYNPREEQLKDVYVVEKIGTKQGWSHPAPNEDWMTGYPQEMQDFMECVDQNREPKCGAALAQDTVAVMYAAYVSAERRGAEVEVPQD